MIVRLHAGLGNQMFQYAFGRSVAAVRNEELFFKKVDLGMGHCRAYSLDAFNIQATFTESQGDYEFEEKISNIYDPEVYTAPPNGYFTGVWQTEKYFNESLVRNELSFKNPMSESSLRIADEIMAAPHSAFVHVRHSGDYVLPEIQAIFGGLDMAYYNKGIDYIRERVEGIKFFIITDDPGWCSERFGGHTIISHGVGDGNNGPASEHEDLWLMSLCNHAVIPSSSFGWWGAWLGDERRPRIVVVPDNWYKIKKRERWEYKSDHIIPERWVRLKYE